MEKPFILKSSIVKLSGMSGIPGALGALGGLGGAGGCGNEKDLEPSGPVNE